MSEDVYTHRHFWEYNGPYLLKYKPHPTYGNIIEVWHPMLHSPINDYIEAGLAYDINGKQLTTK
jgi:hypothetical protein